jgi:hypothetical protein
VLGASREVVTAPDGREWTVGVRWLPRRPRWLGWGFGRRRRARGERAAWWDGADIPDFGGDSLTAWLIVVGLVVAFFLAWFFVFPVLFLLLDLVLVLLLAAGAVAARVLFRRPWIVQAVRGDETREWPVVGWRASRDFALAVAIRLERGLPVDDPPVSSRGTSRGSASPPGER